MTPGGLAFLTIVGTVFYGVWLMIVWVFSKSPHDEEFDGVGWRVFWSLLPPLLGGIIWLQIVGWLRPLAIYGGSTVLVVACIIAALILRADDELRAKVFAPFPAIGRVLAWPFRPIKAALERRAQAARKRDEEAAARERNRLAEEAVLQQKRLAEIEEQERQEERRRLQKIKEETAADGWDRLLASRSDLTNERPNDPAEAIAALARVENRLAEEEAERKRAKARAERQRREQQEAANGWDDLLRARPDLANERPSDRAEAVRALRRIKERLAEEERERDRKRRAEEEARERERLAEIERQEQAERRRRARRDAAQGWDRLLSERPDLASARPDDPDEAITMLGRVQRRVRNEREAAERAAAEKAAAEKAEHDRLKEEVRRKLEADRKRPARRAIDLDDDEDIEI